MSYFSRLCFFWILFIRAFNVHNNVLWIKGQNVNEKDETKLKNKCFFFSLNSFWRRFIHRRLKVFVSRIYVTIIHTFVVIYWIFCLKLFSCFPLLFTHTKYKLLFAVYKLSCFSHPFFYYQRIGNYFVCSLFLGSTCCKWWMIPTCRYIGHPLLFGTFFSYFICSSS